MVIKRTLLIYWLTGVLLVLAPLFRGGNADAGTAFLQLGSLALLVLVLWRRAEKPPLPPSHRIALAGLLALPLIQILPLPTQILELLPGRLDYTAASVLSSLGEQSLLDTLSLQVRESWSGWLTLLLPVAVFLGVRELDTDSLHRLVIVVLVGAAIQALLGLLQFGGGIDSPLYFGQERAHFGSAIGTYSSRNNYVGYMYLSLMVTLAMYFATLGRHRRRAGTQTLRQRLVYLSEPRGHRAFLFGVLCLLLLLAIIFSRSRAGISLTMLGILIASLLFSRRIGGDNVFGLTGTVIAILLGVAVSIGLAPVLDRFSANDPLTDSRWSIFKGAIEGIGQFFPVGSGAGTFRDTFYAFQSLSHSGFVINRVHNDYLEWLYDGGVLAGVLIVLFLAIYVGRWPQIWKRGAWGEFRYIQVGAGLGMLLLLLHEFVDYNLMIPANMIFFAFFAGVFCHAYQEPAPRLRNEQTVAAAPGETVTGAREKPVLQPVTTSPSRNPFHD